MANMMIVLGNGFDLHLHIASSFADFFKRKVLKTNNSGYIYNENNILYYLLYLRFFANGHYDYGSFRRVDNSSPNWMDVEGFIKKTSTEENMFKLLFGAYRQALTGQRVYSINDTSVTATLINIINSRNPSKSGSESVINKLLLEDLLEFEKDFKKYVNGELKIYNDYEKSSKTFFKKICKTANGPTKVTGPLYVINFNYTEIYDSLALCSNVHGTLEHSIVIGYDSTNSSSSKDIYELSKDWQKISAGSHSYDIRRTACKKIVFYGHSLGEQDYPYFFELFDICNILDNSSRVELDFCYSRFGTESEQKAFFNNYQISISKLLNSYERYKKGSDNKNTIVTKLMSQNRLKLLLIDD